MGEAQPVVVITGATRGIGKNMALYFAEQGYKVIGTGRNGHKLLELETQLCKLSPGSASVQMDVQKKESVDEAVRRIREQFETIDVWINNAGAFEAIGPTWEVDPEIWLNDVTTNIFGTFYGIQAAVPVMLEKGHGRIINVVGGGTIGEFKYGNGYGTSKTAIARLTENLDAELEGSGVRAFSLNPGLNDTDMTKFQRETKAGRKYFPRISQAFEEKKDVPLTWAPELAYQLAQGKLDDYHGRILSVYDDVTNLVDKANELQNNDFFKLRMPRLEQTQRS